MTTRFSRLIQRNFQRFFVPRHASGIQPMSIEEQRNWDEMRRRRAARAAAQEVRRRGDGPQRAAKPVGGGAS